MVESEQKRPGPNESVSREKIAAAIRASDRHAVTAPQIAEDADLTVKTVYKHLQSVVEANQDIQTEEIGGSDAYWSVGAKTSGGVNVAGVPLELKLRRLYREDFLQGLELARVGWVAVFAGMLAITLDLGGYYQLSPIQINTLTVILVALFMASVAGLAAAWFNEGRFNGPRRRVDK